MLFNDAYVFVFVLLFSLFNDWATPEIYTYLNTLPLHDAFPIFLVGYWPFTTVFYQVDSLHFTKHLVRQLESETKRMLHVAVVLQQLSQPLCSCRLEREIGRAHV